MTSRDDKLTPDGAYRMQWALATVLSLLFAVGSIFLLLLTEESMRTRGGVGGGAIVGCMIAFFASVVAMGASLGRRWCRRAWPSEVCA